MTGWVAVVVFSVPWAGFGIVSGVVTALIPERAFRRDRSVLRLRRFERGGRWYRRRLRIGRWKDRLPEAAGWFGRGSEKSNLVTRSRADLERFAAETRRAEVVHWANVVFGATFLLWTPWWVGLVMVAFGVLVHGPFIAVQRYNRARLERILGTDAAQAPARRGRRWLRWLRWASLAGAAVSVVVYLAIRPAPVRAVTLAEARERFDESRRADGGPSQATFRPPAGVYEYAGAGTESLDRPPVGQQQGPTMPGTVTHDGPDCWTFRIDYSSKHHQSWRYCARGGGLVEVGGESEQVLDIVVTDVRVASSTTCDDGVMAVVARARPGDAEEQSCQATSTGADVPVTAAGRNTFVGVEPLEIDGARVRALHYHRERTFSGGQDGSEVLDLWFDAETALPLRNRHSVRVRTDSPLGVLTYTEEGSFTLARREPSTR